MKYYAVRNGKRPGIYTSWAECKEQVDGFSCAVYKSFTTESAAKEFLGISQNTQKPSCAKNGATSAKDGSGKPCAKESKPSAKSGDFELCAYVDGSYNIKTREFSYGAVLFINGETLTFSEKFADPELAQMRNVAGEIKGAEFVMRYCAEHGIKSAEIFYDYEGIAAWAEGRWKTNKDGTKAYKALFDSISDEVSIRFVKVKGHSGDKYNDMADALAKKAVGIN